MRKLFFVLAFMLVGIFAFANSYVEKEQSSNLKDSEISITNSALDFINYKNESNTVILGTCRLRIYNYNSEGELTSVDTYEWPSASAADCQAEAKLAYEVLTN